MFGGTLGMALGTIALRALPPVHRSYSSPVWKAKKWVSTRQAKAVLCMSW